MSATTTDLELEEPVSAPQAKHSFLGRIATLRRVLFVAFTLIALIPVGILGLWTERSALEKEIAEVSDRHLLLAQNLSYALDRYSEDAEAVFELAIADLQTVEQTENIHRKSLRELLARIGFDHICILEKDGTVAANVEIGPPRIVTGNELHVAMLRNLAEKTPWQVAFSGVMNGPHEAPMIFLVRTIGNGRIAIGGLKTDYLITLQKAIAFGEKGHSAIVDQNGRVLAHPNENWRLEMKDISAVSAVQKMMAGQTGVAQFYSPAMKADMIAGHTTTMHTGWGVMVPQPISELEAHADSVQSATILIGSIGFLIAIALAWFLSRLLSAPIVGVARAAHAAGNGNLLTRIPALPRTTPSEIQDMAAALNQMLAKLQDSNEQLVVAAEEAEAANKSKSHFMANMSHEFRTPLNAIMGYSDAMRAQVFGPLGDSRYEDYATNVHNAGQHLLGLVEEILELTRVEAGKLSLSSGEVDLREAAAFAVSMVKNQADANQIKLQIDVAPDVPSVHNDRAKLHQILINLLSNAVKFTDPGGWARIDICTDTDWAVVLRVSDNGMGIAPEDIDVVMKPFGQVASAFARNHGGTGLGLPLTKQLITLMGGTFELGQREGGGTVVTIRLPQIAPRAAA